MLPREEVLGPLNRLATEQLKQLRMTVQIRNPFRQCLRIFRRDQITSLPITDRKFDASDISADHWGTTGHRLHRGNPKRLIPWGRDKDVGGVIVVFEFLTPSTSYKHHFVGYFFLFSQRSESTELGCQLRIRMFGLAANNEESRRNIVLLP